MLSWVSGEELCVQLRSMGNTSSGVLPWLKPILEVNFLSIFKQSLIISSTLTFWDFSQLYEVFFMGSFNGVPFFKVLSRRLRKQRTGCWSEKEMTEQNRGAKDMSLSAMEGWTLTCGNPRSWVRKIYSFIQQMYIEHLYVLGNVLRGGLVKQNGLSILGPYVLAGEGNRREWAEHLLCVSPCITCCTGVLSFHPHCLRGGLLRAKQLRSCRTEVGIQVSDISPGRVQWLVSIFTQMMLPA